ncbi:TPA: hypothetical protein DDZ86_01590 [Candidatus Dependentiae bacterium]|nr:MAG: hypothetical protein UW09_C0001G0318 [candidate division TM6 bacterium GW2011_GWF2_43_87]HBL98317.1 hypothetical protein [Candidatus Dependentiae bacterium]
MNIKTICLFGVVVLVLAPMEFALNAFDVKKLFYKTRTGFLDYPELVALKTVQEKLPWIKHYMKHPVQNSLVRVRTFGGSQQNDSVIIKE